MRKSKNCPLTVEVTKSELVIRIGINTLAFAAEHNPDLFDPETNKTPPYRRIVNKIALAKDTANALLEERENGSTPISRVLDECIESAIEGGSEAVEWK